MITNKDTVNKSMPLFYLQQFHKLPMISESSKKGMVKKLAIMLNKTEDQSFLQGGMNPLQVVSSLRRKEMVRNSFKM
jgi:hypothetical protein